MMMLATLSLIAALYGCVNGEVHNYHFIKVLDGQDVHQDITFDSEANTVTIIVGDVSNLTGVIGIQTVNFHDFDSGYVAFKDITGGRCLITEIPIPFPTPYLYSMGRTNLTMPYDAVVDSTELTYENVVTRTGQRIAEFCTGQTSMMMTLTRKVHQGIAKRDAEESVAFCAICLLSLCL